MRGFTLIELVVVMGIVALLLSVLLPALSAVRGNANALVCSSNMRTIALEFAGFAENTTADGRGDSEQLGPNRFWINDLQEHFYGIDEFWDQGAESTGTVKAGKNGMLCPAGARRLTKRRGFPCGSAAVGPVEDVSLAMNMRLYRAEVTFKGERLLAPAASTHVRSAVLRHPYVPVVMDVDGREAAARRIEPFYIAPPLQGVADGPYADGRFWMPSRRHGGKTNVAFVGGHVLRSETPGLENWDWEYQASAGP